MRRAIALLEHAVGRDISEGAVVSSLKRLIPEESPKYLVDVGAYDGLLTSNSYAFVREGWQAILIEPLPKPFRLLSKRYADNPNVKCVNKACATSSGPQPLFIGAAGEVSMTSTLCLDENEWFKATRSGRAIDVQVDTLTNICLQNECPRDFALLSIDTEGMDYEVLRGLDFERFQPRIIVTEEYRWNIEKHRRKCQLLRDERYGEWGVVGSNSIWTRQ